MVGRFLGCCLAIELTGLREDKMESWYCKECDEIHQEGQTCASSKSKLNEGLGFDPALSAKLAQSLRRFYEKVQNYLRRSALAL